MPEGSNIGRALNQAMADIEAVNHELVDALPKNYQEVPNTTLVKLIKLLDPVNLEGDAFGYVYEYMMGALAMQEMQKGGEFYIRCPRYVKTRLSSRLHAGGFSRLAASVA